MLSKNIGTFKGYNAAGSMGRGRKVPTIQVKDKATGLMQLVNRRDFNHNIHEPVDAREKTAIASIHTAISQYSSYLFTIIQLETEVGQLRNEKVLGANSRDRAWNANTDEKITSKDNELTKARVQLNSLSSKLKSLGMLEQVLSEVKSGSNATAFSSRKEFDESLEVPTMDNVTLGQQGSEDITPVGGSVNQGGDLGKGGGVKTADNNQDSKTPPSPDDLGDIDDGEMDLEEE